MFFLFSVVSAVSQTLLDTEYYQLLILIQMNINVLSPKEVIKYRKKEQRGKYK